MMSKGELFSEYVRKYAEARGISIQEAKEHKIVWAYWEWLNEK